MLFYRKGEYVIENQILVSAILYILYETFQFFNKSFDIEIKKDVTYT